jgi:hypothetical protein
MKIESASITVVTAQLANARRFYQQHFAARPLFDCGWYVVLRSNNRPELCLMEPQKILLCICLPATKDRLQQASLTIIVVSKMAYDANLP